MMLKFVLLCFFISMISTQQVIEDILCEGRSFEPKCPQGTLRIVAASFGVTDSAFCGGSDHSAWSVNCAVDVVETIRRDCAGRTNCSVPVEGRNACAGSVKYLQVVWGCENGIPQNRVNARGSNIVASANAARSNPIPLHGQTVRGSSVYVFIAPSDQILEVRWFIDQTDLVVTTSNQAPFELYSGRPWDTTTLPDGTHRVMAMIAFNDLTMGTIDATITIRNGAPVAAAAQSKPSDSYVESATVSERQPAVPSTIPWTLFGVAAAVAAILIVVIILKAKSTPARA